MTPRLARQSLGLLAAALTLTIAAACGSDSKSPTGGGNTLVADTLQGEGSLLAREVEASVTSMTVPGTSKHGGESTDRTHAFGFATASRIGSAPVSGTNGETIWSYSGCGTVAPSSPGDDDNDGVPDSVTITFSLPACALGGVRGKTEGDITGQLTIVDPDEFNTSNSFRTLAQDVKFAFTNGTATFSEKRNGTRSVTGDSATLSQTNSIATEFDSASAPVTTTTNTLALAFTNTSTVPLDQHDGLSNGTLTVNGGFTWNTVTTTDAFTITTVTPLVYNPGCSATGTTPFTAGELRAVIESAGRTGHLRIVWTGCGIATVTYIPT